MNKKIIVKEIKQIKYTDKLGYEEVRYIETKREVKIKNKADLYKLPKLNNE